MKSAYELQRERNMEENSKIMDELGLQPIVDGKRKRKDDPPPEPEQEREPLSHTLN